MEETIHAMAQNLSTEHQISARSTQWRYFSLQNWDSVAMQLK